MPNSIDLEKVRDALVAAAKEAGQIIKDKAGKMGYVNKGTVDFVTETDKKVEDLINKTLIEQFPDYKFFGEESYTPGKQLTDEPTFIVDPIDGTTNFIHGLPFSVTSLGFSVNKVPTVGVIYNPHLDLLYSAIKGKGAFLNGNPLPKLTRPLSLDTSLLAIEWGTGRIGNNFKVKTNTFKNLADEEGTALVHGFRSFGSAAMNIAQTATGEVDAYWEGGCWAWDVCAGWVILEETGGRMVSANPGKWDIPVDGRLYLAVRGAPEEDQKKFIEDFWSNIDGELEYPY